MRSLAAMKADGIRAVMLTGDNRTTAEAVAAGLGIEARAELLRWTSSASCANSNPRGSRSRRSATASTTPRRWRRPTSASPWAGGTDVALETADAAVLHGRVRDVPDMIALSKATMGNIRANITIALGLKAVFLVTTVLGITGLWPAILADTGATVLVTANAMRLSAGSRGNFEARSTDDPRP